MNPKLINVIGAEPLSKYTEGILLKGFSENGYKQSSDSNWILYQIHGAPHSEKDDDQIIERLGSDLLQNDEAKRVVLLHRPDEIKIRHANLESILKSTAKTTGLVFLGDMHINDEFFESDNLIKEVIPHGFFKLDSKLQTSPVIIGSHTSWGEMRSVKHLFKLLGKVFEFDSEVVGYAGGTFFDNLNLEGAKDLWTQLNPSIQANFLDGSALLEKNGNYRIIFNSAGPKPDNIEMSFNTQMYFLNSQIRTGESSGSVHSSTGIPVILEMNGSEKLEDLRVVKVPYTDVTDIDSINFTKAAEEIVELIQTKKFENMLSHNLKQAYIFTPKYIADKYINLFNNL